MGEEKDSTGPLLYLFTLLLFLLRPYGPSEFGNSNSNGLTVTVADADLHALHAGLVSRGLCISVQLFALLASIPLNNNHSIINYLQ